MRHLAADDLLLDRLLTLAWRAAQVGAVIDPKPSPYHGAPEEGSLDELERQIRELERERFEAYDGGAA